MNRERAKELLPIMEAYAHGKNIEYRADVGSWVNVNNLMYEIGKATGEYRIKSEPRVLWVYPMGKDEFEATTIKENTKNFAGVFKAIEVLEDD